MNKFKVTYISVETGKSVKKDFPTLAALREFVKKRGISQYDVWQRSARYSKS